MEDALLCSEDILGSPWGEANAQVHSTTGNVVNNNLGMFTNFPPRSDAELVALLEREVTQMPHWSYDGSSQSDDDVAVARSSAIQWMLKVRNAFSFTPMTVALAVSYLDRYLLCHLQRPFKLWVVQLLSVACISLAAKMEEIMVPCLQDLQVDCIQHVFEASAIQRMELVVLKALGWRMGLITPFEYVDDLLHRLDVSEHTKVSISARTTELILGSFSEIEFVPFQSSVVALSAIVCALEETVPLKTDMFKCILLASLPVDPISLERCYMLMEELVVDPLWPVMSQNHHSYHHVETSNSPPSPLTVIEMSHQRARNERNSINWIGSGAHQRQEEEIRNDNPKKRKAAAKDDEEISWQTKRVTIECSNKATDASIQ